MYTSFFRIISGIILTLGIVSCSNTKYLKEGQILYTGAKINIVGDSISSKDKKELETALQGRLTPKPNSSFLGLRPKLFLYNTTKEPTKQKGFRYWKKYKMGEAPVLLGSVDQDFNKNILVNYSENKGFFNAKASSQQEIKNKKAKIIYTLKPGKRYRINKVEFPSDSSEISRDISLTKEKTLLKIGKPFDLETIKSERNRIDSKLKEKGYYYFNPDHLIIQVDSASTKGSLVNLYIKLKENTPKQAKEKWSVDNIIVFPNYSIQDVKDNLYSVPMSPDSLSAKYLYKDKYIIDPKYKFKPKVFDRTLYFDKGDYYNRADHNLSLNRLINLGVFKFVKNEFIVKDSLQHKFDVYYLLTPRPFQSLRLEVLGRTNSANYGGGELNINHTHRNLFRGAEQLKTSIYGAFDMQFGGQRDANNIFRAGVNTQLTIPRIVAPFRFHSSSAFVPKTNINIGYEYQNRTQLYTLHNFNTSFGYVWKENAQREHDLKIFNSTLVFPEKVTNRYTQQMANNPNLQRVVEKQLIFGPTYTYTYTNTMLPRKTTFYYRGMADLAGNLTGLILGANAKKDNQKEIFKIPFSQFAKIENDFRVYHQLGQKSSLAGRLIAGVAYPYGNSQYIPFSKQFFVGGSNSVRAFRARTLGPGSYDPRTQNASFFFDQSGDIKLEMNAEYRTNIYKFLNIALFADAGNIWLVNENPTLPGGKFSKDFLKELAVGAGVGMRLDFNIMVLRLDLAMPLRVPYYEKGNRWTFNQIDLTNKSWRRDNLVLNIAIGYPF